MTSHEPAQNRFWLLDNLRGLASLCVIVWHYQHFYTKANDALPADFVIEQQPFSHIFSLFYAYGFHAVQLFYCLSGFVFFYVYYVAILERRSSLYNFSAARLARLYPLHLVTLVFVAFVQQIFLVKTGYYFVFQHNDIKYFIPSLFMASNWGIEKGLSFNGPIWTVSIEIVIYYVFFAFASACRFLPIFRGKDFILTALAGGFFFTVENFVGHKHLPGYNLAHAATCFFVGGFAFLLLRQCARRNVSVRARTLLRVLFFVASAILFAVGVAAFGLYKATGALHLVAFPSLILGLGLINVSFLNLGRRFHIVGDITYSTYLIHFPIQLAIVTFLQIFSLKLNFDSHIVFVLFFASVIVLSTLTFHYFEKPMQSWLLRTLTGRRPERDTEYRRPLDREAVQASEL